MIDLSMTNCFFDVCWGFPARVVFSIERKKYCNYCISHLSSLVCNCSTGAMSVVAGGPVRPGGGLSTTGLRRYNLSSMLTISQTERCQLFISHQFIRNNQTDNYQYMILSLSLVKYQVFVDLFTLQSGWELQLKSNKRKHFYAWIQSKIQRYIWTTRRYVICNLSRGKGGPSEYWKLGGDIWCSLKLFRKIGIF